MTTQAIAQSAAPILQRNSDHCFITVDLNQHSYRRHTNIGPMTEYYKIWIGYLLECEDLTGEDEPLAVASGDSASIRERDELIRSLKFQARAMGYKRCTITDHTLHGYTETKVLRATRPSAKALAVAKFLTSAA